MLTLVFCLRRKSTLSRADFQYYWRENHGPLMQARMAAFGATRYRQLHTVVGAEAEMIATSRGTQEPYDGVAVVEWTDLEAFRRFNDTEGARTAGREMYRDELNFIDLERSTIFLTETGFEALGPDAGPPD